jgi:hypothetical protein
MPVDETHTVKLTFSRALPLGECAHFTHNGEPWIAVPARKYAGIRTVTDRLIGATARVLAKLDTIPPRWPDSVLLEAISGLRGAMHAALETKGSGI